MKLLGMEWRQEMQVGMEGFGETVLVEVFRFFPLEDLVNASLVSKSWNRAASYDAVWESLLEAHAENKVYVLSKPHKSAKEKFKSCWEDSKRTTIEFEELCAFDWLFR